MQTRYWLAHTLKHIAVDIEESHPSQAEELRKIAVMIEVIDGRKLRQEAFICNCGAIVPGSKTDVARHLLTH